VWIDRGGARLKAGKLLVAAAAILGFALSVIPAPTFASTTTFTFTCTMNGGASAASIALTISGGSGTSLSPTSENCDGSGHTVTVTYTTLSGATVTATVPADTGTVKYRYAGGTYGSSSGETYTGSACGSSSCPAVTTPNLYEGISITGAMDPVSPSTWDASYSEPFFGYQLGVLSTIVTVGLTSGSGTASASGFGDYNTKFCFESAWQSTAAPADFWGIGQTGGAIAQCSTETVAGTTLTEIYKLSPGSTPGFSTVALGNDWYQGVTETVGGVVALGNDWYQGVAEIFGTLKSGSDHESGLAPDIFMVCGNHTDNTPLCSIQPVQFSPLGGIAVQVVTFSGCAPGVPAVLGDGNTYEVQVQGSCLLTASLPAGYIWTGVNSANVQTTTCSGGTCTAWVLTYSAAQPTAVTLTVNNPAQPVGGTAVFTATTPTQPSSPYTLDIFDYTNSTATPLISCTSSPCVVGVTSHHNSAQVFEAAITSTGAISGAVATSSKVTVIWGTGGGNGLCVSYKLLLGGIFPAPTLTYTANAQTLTATVPLAGTAGAPLCVPVDSGTSWSVSGYLAGSLGATVERARTLNTTSSSSLGTFVFVYWHQLFVPVSYTTTDTAATNQPSIILTQFGSNNGFSNSKTPTSYWVDFNSPWTAANPWTTSPDLKTLYATPASGQVVTPSAIIVAYGTGTAGQCVGANPLAVLEANPASCFVPAIVAVWDANTGPLVYFSFIVLGVNVMVYNKTQSIVMSLIVLLVAGAVFGYFIPPSVQVIANVFLYLGATGVVVRVVLALRS
jgi:hypothetical protein